MRRGAAAALLGLVAAWLLGRGFDPRAWLLPPRGRLLSAAELARYRGAAGQPGLYLAVLGRVFDVERGRKHYGPGGAYSGLAGTAGGRGRGVGPHGGLAGHWWGLAGAHRGSHQLPAPQGEMPPERLPPVTSPRRGWWTMCRRCRRARCWPSRGGCPSTATTTTPWVGGSGRSDHAQGKHIRRRVGRPAGGRGTLHCVAPGFVHMSSLVLLETNVLKPVSDQPERLENQT